MVAGYTAWQKNFGRQVNRGEKAIKIFAPMTYKRKKEVDMIDQETGQPLRNPDGSVRKEIIEVTVPSFRVTNVFDISQTSGPPLPTLVDELEGNVERYQDFVQAIRNISPVPVGFEEMDKEDALEAIRLGQTVYASVSKGRFEEVTAEQVRDMSDDAWFRMPKEQMKAYVELRTEKDLHEEMPSLEETQLFICLPENQFGIYQIDPEGNGRDYMFLSHDSLEDYEMEMRSEDYRLEYVAPLTKADTMDTISVDSGTKPAQRRVGCQDFCTAICCKLVASEKELRRTANEGICYKQRIHGIRRWQVHFICQR